MSRDWGSVVEVEFGESLGIRGKGEVVCLRHEVGIGFGNGRIRFSVETELVDNLFGVRRKRRDVNEGGRRRGCAEV
jgi:hypothetical protein